MFQDMFLCVVVWFPNLQAFFHLPVIIVLHDCAISYLFYKIKVSAGGANVLKLIHALLILTKLKTALTPLCITRLRQLNLKPSNSFSGGSVSAVITKGSCDVQLTVLLSLIQSETEMGGVHCDARCFF